MDGWKNRLRDAVTFASEAAAETLWPTRCALCDAPGAVLCGGCTSSLPYLDWWRACHRCGSAYGHVQCDACNPVYIGRIGRDTWPFAACASATAFSAETGHIVGVFKDQGEQRLAAAMAACMVRTVPPDWPVDAVTFVPATLAAVRFRGFDHAELLARETARVLDVPHQQLLARPRTRDQRKLTRGQRIANLAGSFRAASDAGCGLRLLLIDDVFTTGATLCAATDALLASGAVEVRCLTFARV